jgi:hypothetical protein
MKDVDVNVRKRGNATTGYFGAAFCGALSCLLSAVLFAITPLKWLIVPWVASVFVFGTISFLLGKKFFLVPTSSLLAGFMGGFFLLLVAIALLLPSTDGSAPIAAVLYAPLVLAISYLGVRIGKRGTVSDERGRLG